MKFVDKAKIQIKSGKGGSGCVSFRREKYVPKGGPDGGDGGRGGHVILEASSQKDTLYRFHWNQHFKAKNGQPGQGANKHGSNGADLVVQLPLGTCVLDPNTREILADFSQAGQRFMAAKGGRGGRGNARFTSSTNRAPRRFDPGEPGEEMTLLLELKLLADVGLVGLPNAGKSSLISRLSQARPKIADYPFTTLIPNLGVVVVDEEHSFVMADIPGLIAGASQGAGLGHRFLKHIERCRVLLHVIDATRVKADAPLEVFSQVQMELAAFHPELTRKKHLVAVNKLDLLETNDAVRIVSEALPDQEVLGISAVNGLGLRELKFALFRILNEAKDDGGD